MPIIDSRKNSGSDKRLSPPTIHLSFPVTIGGLKPTWNKIPVPVSRILTVVSGTGMPLISLQNEFKFEFEFNIRLHLHNPFIRFSATNCFVFLFIGRETTSRHKLVPKELISCVVKVTASQDICRDDGLAVNFQANVSWHQTAASKLYQKIHGGCQKVGPKVAKFLDR